MTKKYPSQNLKQVLLRIPEEMRQALEDAANLSGRTLTAEVLMRIERTLDEDAKTGGIVGNLQNQIDRIMEILVANGLTDPLAPAFIDAEDEGKVNAPSFNLLKIPTKTTD